MLTRRRSLHRIGSASVRGVCGPRILGLWRREGQIPIKIPLQRLWAVIRMSSHFLRCTSVIVLEFVLREADSGFTFRIISSIASHIDLNTLDALSLTCRQVRANLLQFRTQLLASTLHCENEDVELDSEHTFRYRARAADWYFVDMGRDVAGVGKVGDCARDMVGGCRRCGRVVCRVSPVLPRIKIILTYFV